MDTKTIEDKEYKYWHLAEMADCASPDNEDSAGAKFLYWVADATAEVIANYRENKVSEDMYDYSGDLHEIADGAPDVYTYKRWQEFTDLAAWNEDPSELGLGNGDMTTQAGVCLYMIAERLVRALVEAHGPYDIDGDDDADKGDDDK